MGNAVMPLKVVPTKTRRGISPCKLILLQGGSLCTFNPPLTFNSKEIYCNFGRNPAPAPPGMEKTILVNNGLNYQPQLVNAGFLNQQQLCVLATHRWARVATRYKNCQVSGPRLATGMYCWYLVTR